MSRAAIAAVVFVFWGDAAPLPHAPSTLFSVVTWHVVNVGRRAIAPGVGMSWLRVTMVAEVTQIHRGWAPDDSF
jgi:hypothetical protein